MREIGGLLSVSMPDGLRHVVEDQIAAPHAAPAEAVRCLFAWGAERVDISLRRRSVELVGDRARCPERAATLWRDVIAARDDASFGSALGALEQHGWQAVVWLLALRPRGVVVQAGGHDCFRWTEQDGPSVHEGPVATPGVRVHIVRPRADLAAIRRGLRASCRHATRPVTLDGDELRGPLGGGAFRVQTRHPVPGELVLGVEDPTPRITLLRHGVVAARASVPGRWPAYRAVVEVAGLTSDPCTAADCREAIRPHLYGLTVAALQAGLRVVPGLAGAGAWRQRRIVRFLLQGAAQGMCAEEISRAPFLPVIAGTGRRFVSPDDVRDTPALRVAAGDPPRGLRGLVVDPDHRTLLAELVGSHIHEAAEPLPGSGWRRWLLRAAAAVTLAMKRRLEPDADEAVVLATALKIAAAREGEEIPAVAVLLGGRRQPGLATGGRLVVGRHSDAMRCARRVVAAGGDPVVAALAILPGELGVVPEALEVPV